MKNLNLIFSHHFRYRMSLTSAVEEIISRIHRFFMPVSRETLRYLHFGGFSGYYVSFS